MTPNNVASTPHADVTKTRRPLPMYHRFSALMLMVIGLPIAVGIIGFSDRCPGGEALSTAVVGFIAVQLLGNTSELAEIQDQIDERNPRLLTLPIAAFYSRNDGAVDWRTCIDDINPNVDNIEVDSSHLGITLDPIVWLEIAERLAR